MTVLQRELDADAERIAVLRAVAIAAQPLRRGLVERRLELLRAGTVEALRQLVFHQPAGQNLRIVLIVAGGEAKPGHGADGGLLLRLERRHLVAHQRRIVDHLARRAELHRPVGIAFARCERVAERDDEEILDHDLALDEFAPVGQLHGNGNARVRLVERPGHARDGQLAVAGKLLGFALAGLARLPAPDAIAGHAGKRRGSDLDYNGMGVGKDEILLRAAP